MVFVVFFSPSRQIIVHVGFEVLAAVDTKKPAFWDITPCTPLKVNRRFGGICRLHLQGRRISQASFTCYLCRASFFAWFILRPRRLRRRVPPKRQLTFNGLHGVKFQKIKYQIIEWVHVLGCFFSNLLLTNQLIIPWKKPFLRR
jgi:hypothetical protein